MKLHVSVQKKNITSTAYSLTSNAFVQLKKYIVPILEQGFPKILPCVTLINLEPTHLYHY